MQAEPVLNFRWEYFTSHWSTKLDVCFDKQYFVDLSLVCRDGTVLKCHKMVLASCSSFFQRLLVNNEHPHPMIILHDIETEDLRQIINFMYTGEIDILKNEVKRVLKIAKILEVSGLKDINPSFQFPSKSKTINLTNKKSSPPPLVATSTAPLPFVANINRKNNILKTDLNDSNENLSSRMVESPIVANPTNSKRRNKDSETAQNAEKSITTRSKDSESTSSVQKPVATRSSYNLRQRNVKTDKETDKKPDISTTNIGNSLNQSKKSNTSVNNNSNINDEIDTKPQVDTTIDNISNNSINSCKRPQADACKYLKKLKLLNEVEIINRPYKLDNNSVPNPVSSGHVIKSNNNINNTSNDNRIMNCGIYIKDEVDISSDESDFTPKLVDTIKKATRKKTLLTPGVEIFRASKTTTIQEPKASTSRSSRKNYNTNDL